MENPEPNPRVQNLRRQYILLLKKENYSFDEATAITKIRFDKLSQLRSLNPDKLSYLMQTEELTDESIYTYMISVILNKKKIEKNEYIQQIR